MWKWIRIENDKVALVRRLIFIIHIQGHYIWIFQFWGKERRGVLMEFRIMKVVSKVALYTHSPTMILGEWDWNTTIASTPIRSYLKTIYSPSPSQIMCRMKYSSRLIEICFISEICLAPHMWSSISISSISSLPSLEWRHFVCSSIPTL